MNSHRIPADKIIEALDRAFPDLIFICDREGTYLATFGGKDESKYHDPSEMENLAGLRIQDILPARTAARLHAAIHQAIDEDRLVTVVYAFDENSLEAYSGRPGPTGEQWFEARISPLPGANGNPGDAIVALVYNITERLDMERRLKQLASTDELTGLPNRRDFRKRAEQQLALARRRSHPLSLAMLDIDNFKHINDRYGHIGGDEALQAFSEIMQSTTRECDIPARIGGEEFALLLPMTSAMEALVIGERLRETVAAATRVLPGSESSLSMTVSIGLCSREQVSEADDIESLLREADRALYHAKRNGRNRVVAYSPQDEQDQHA